MCQLKSLRELFQVWRVVPNSGIRAIHSINEAFSLRDQLMDSDCDGLPDALEAKLLEKFRPYFKFSQDNGNDDDNRPADVVWYIKNCEVLLDASGWTMRLTNNEVAFNPEKIIQIPIPEIDPDFDYGPTDILLNPRRTKNHLTVPESMRDQVWGGASWDEILNRGNVGFYGHVVPVYLDDNKEKQYFKIEYWLFCPFNNDHAGGVGNHEADWMTVQLIYDPDGAHLTTDSVPASVLEDNKTVFPLQNIYSVIHYAHGTKREFVMDHATSYANMNEDGTAYLGLGSHDIQVMFFQDPVSGAWCHPVVYIEYGSHEFWPTQGGFEAGAPNHDGNSFSFLTTTPPNIGEVEKPVTKETDAARLILRFNGSWGYYNQVNSPPPGPILHYAWSWFSNINDPADPNYRGNITRIRIPNDSLE